MNKKGITTIEILITFTIVMIISLSVFQVVATYRIKADIAFQRNELTTLKNIITKDVVNDLTNAEVINVEECGTDCFEFTFVDNSTKKLIINKSDPSNKTIEYGEFVYDFKDRIPSPLPVGTTASDFETIKINTTGALSTKIYIEDGTAKKNIYFKD